MNKSKAKIALTGRTLCVALMAAFAVSLGAQFAAAGDNFLTDLGGYLDEIRGALVALAPAVAGLAWVIAKIWQIIIPEQQGRVEPREWARNAVVSYIAIVVGMRFIFWVGSFFGG